MNYYKATIQYDGTNYCGFQWQKNLRTIQNDFNLSLKIILNGKVTTMGASRTDSGVHAFEQFVKITSEEKIDCETFLLALNQSLPPQVKCLSLIPSEALYRPTTGSISKEYRYLFTNTLRSSCEDQLFIANNPYSIDIDLMKKSAQEIVGEHDFRNFCSAGSNVKTTIRNIIYSEISEINPHSVISRPDLFPLSSDLKNCYQFQIIGNGFLKQMVRHLMSALFLVGSGRLSPEEFSALLDGKEKNKRLWKVADPRGLYLYRFHFYNKL